jgi:hypothetical protein
MGKLVIILLFLSQNIFGQVLMSGSNIVGNGSAFLSLENTHSVSQLNKMNIYPTFLSPVNSIDTIIVHAIKSDGTVLFGHEGNTLYKSIDGGITYLQIILYFIDAPKINSAYIFGTNKIFFTTYDNKSYTIDKDFTVITQIYLKHGSTGLTYTFHNPANSNYPGAYFDCRTFIKGCVISGREIMFFGNYTNTPYGRGASPVNIYYSADTGKTFKTAFEFGRNPNYRDNGTAEGSNTGTWLGDATQSIICRHIHDVNYISYNNTFLCYTGDFNGELEWMQGTYDAITDTWTWVKLLDGSYDKRYEVGGLIVENDTLTVSTDITTVGTNRERGIYKLSINDIADTGKYYYIYKASKALGALFRLGSVYIYRIADDTDYKELAISTNSGKTFSSDHFPSLPSGTRLMPISEFINGRILFRTKIDNVYPNVGTYWITIK